MWWKDPERLMQTLRQEPWGQELPENADFWARLIEWIENQVLSEFLTQFVKQIDEIIEINPELNEQEILAKATHLMVDFLQADSASVRFYDP